MQAIILAGGQSSRMGRDKAFVTIEGKSLLQHQLDTFIQDGVSCWVLANENKLLKLPVFYQAHPLIHVTDDEVASFQGPLSGLLAGLRQLPSGADNEVVVIACDVFGLPGNVFSALSEKRKVNGADIACLDIDGYLQPLVAILSLSLLSSLEAFFQQGGRSVVKWYKQHTLVSLNERDLQALGLCALDYATNLNSVSDVEVFLKE